MLATAAATSLWRAPARLQHGQAGRRPPPGTVPASQPCVCAASRRKKNARSRGSQPGSGAVTLEDVASMLQGMDKKVDALDEKVDALDEKVDALDEKVDAVDKKVDALDEKVDAVDKKVDAVSEVQATQGQAQTTQGQTLGALAERSIRVERFVTGEDKELRHGVEIETVDDLLRILSLPGQPASREALLCALPSSPAVHKLFDVVRRMMQEEADALDAQLPAAPSHPHAPQDVKRWLSESRATVLAARPKGRGKPAWLPACKGLEALAEASAGGTGVLAFLERQKQSKLVLMLLAAWATDRLSEKIEMDGKPIVQAAHGGVEVDLLEIKVQPSGIKEAVRQLRAQADILLLALALSNPSVLQPNGAVHVVGTVAVAAGKPTLKQREAWGSLQLTVGSAGPAPKAAMLLRIRR